MYLVAKTASINARQGNFVLSHTDLVERARLGHLFPTKLGHLPSDALGKILDDQKEKQTHDLLLAVNPANLPADISELIKYGELYEDLERFCKAVVFCSYLFSTRGKWVNGFIIEKAQEDKPANGLQTFSQMEIQALSSQFLDSPMQTIFLNASDKDGGLTNDLGFFPALAFHLGYLKAVSDLSEKTPGIGTISYELKSACAAFYASISAQILFLNLLKLKSEEYRHYLEPVETLVKAHSELADFYQQLLGPKDVATLRWFMRQHSGK